MHKHNIKSENLKKKQNNEVSVSATTTTTKKSDYKEKIVKPLSKILKHKNEIDNNP